MNRNIFEHDEENAQENERNEEEILALQPEDLKLVGGGDIGAGVIRIPK